MISRLGPQGIEVFAQRTLTQAATSGKTEKQRRWRGLVRSGAA